MGLQFFRMRCKPKSSQRIYTGIHREDAALDLDSSGAWKTVQVESLEKMFSSGAHNRSGLLQKRADE